MAIRVRYTRGVLICGLDCLICGLDCRICGLDCLICGIDCLTCGFDCLICGIDCLTCGFGCLILQVLPTKAWLVAFPQNAPSGARSVHLFITMIKWIRTSRLSKKNSLLQVLPTKAWLVAFPQNATSAATFGISCLEKST